MINKTYRSNDRKMTYEQHLNCFHNYLLNPFSFYKEHGLYYDESILYKYSINCDFVSICPKGIKSFCWLHNDMITNEFKISTCNFNFKLPLNNSNSNMSNKQKNKLTFNDYKMNINETICYGGLEGTLLIGIVSDNTTFKKEGSEIEKTFFVEDILFYKGTLVANKNWIEKLQLFYELFNNYLNKPLFKTNDTLRFVLPNLYNSIKTFINDKQNISYNISGLQYKKILLKNKYQYCPYDYFETNFIKSSTDTFTDKNSHSHSQKCVNNSIKNQKNNKLLDSVDVTFKDKDKVYSFWTKADVKCDIYKLYKSQQCNKMDLIGTALIPDYKSSIFMNNIFRDIKENKNIDALEESDDEFEKSPDDFVDINKCILIKYNWNPRFNKYFPII